MAAAYLISRKDAESLDTIVFSAGPEDAEEAVAVFTDPTSAEKYLEDAGWEREYVVAAVEPIQFLRWLLFAYDDGIDHLVVDPIYAEQQAGQQLNTLSIEGHLEHAGSHIVNVARPDF